MDLSNNAMLPAFLEVCGGGPSQTCNLPVYDDITVCYNNWCYLSCACNASL